MAEKTGSLYLIQHRESGMSYVGQTRQTNVKERWRQHGYNDQPISAAIRGFGREAFEFSVLARVPVSQLNSEETSMIDYYGTLWPKGYNQRAHDSRVKTMSDRSRAKISRTLRTRALFVEPWNKGVPLSMERREHLSRINQGKKQSPETVEKRAAKLRGRKFTEQQLNAHTERVRKLGADPGFRAKVSAAKRGQKFSDEHRAKLSAAQLGKKRGPQSPEHIAKRMASIAKAPRAPNPKSVAALSERNRQRRGKPVSETHRRNMAAAQQLRAHMRRQAFELRSLNLGVFG